ncbi:MAG TPA: hypothetical protein VGM39_00625 [Kofleriaceae bacterium]|jgi:hypothetical protein
MATHVQDFKHLAGARFLVPFLIAVALCIALAFATLVSPTF